METNSKEYWEQRFSDGDWEKNEGDEQSIFFSTLFLQEIPEWLREDLSRNNWDLADYGCAEGGGTDVLGREFPTCSVTGYDFSEAAIAKACRQYNSCRFAVADIFEEIPETDVVFSSNTLEHLPKPSGVLQRLVAASRKHTIFMLPFEDDFGYPEHINTFSAGFFPDECGNHYLSCFKVIDQRDAEFTHWLGKQVMVVYTNRNFRKPSNYRTAELYNTCAKQYLEEAHQKKLDEKKLRGEFEQQLSTITEDCERLRLKNKAYTDTMEKALACAENLATHKKFKLIHLISRLRHQLLGKNRQERRKFFKWILIKLKGHVDFDHRYNPIYEVIDILKWNSIAESSDAGCGQYVGSIDMSYLLLNEKGKLAVHCQEQDAILTAAMNSPDNDEVLKIRKAIHEREYKGILIFPHIVYWEPLQTPQQLLRAFAKEGWLCLFCEHPNLREQYREVEPNLFITGEAEVVKAIGNHNAVVLLTWMGSLPFVNRIPNCTIWYHILDHLEIFSYYDEAYLALHNNLVKAASVLSYVAEPLKQQYKLGDKALYLPNGVNPEEIRRAIHPDFVPEDMKPILAKKHKIVGYYGYLAEWMDYDMVRWLANLHPDYEFVFIGQAIYDTSPIANVSNIHLLGLKPYKELFDYAKYFDVATIPFVLDEKMDCVSPIKFYEYLALGKPVVSSAMPEVAKYAEKSNFVFNANNRGEFHFYLQQAMLPEIAAEAKNKGLEFASSNSWAARAQTVQFSLNAIGNTTLALHSTCPDIIQFAIIDYNFRFQRPQHLARRMAQNGHRVFYVNTAFVPGDSFSIEQIEKNVYQVFLPFQEDISIHCTDLSNRMEQLKGCLDKLVYEWVIKDAVVIADYPNWIHAVDYMNQKYGFRVITDYMDDYTGFLNPAEQIVRENCVKLLKQSNMIVSSSNFLYEIAKKYSDSVVISRNGTEYAYFHKIVDSDRPANARPVIGYYGAIAEWFNVCVVCRCAERFPDCDIVLVGNVSAHRQELEKYPNIRLIGEVPYSELLPWLDSFDVCLIPFDTSTDLIKATNPVKFYEYLSAGKKIVATEIPELMPYKDQFVYLENDPDKFCDKVALCLNNQDSLADRERMFAFARQNDWDCRAGDFEAAIMKVHPKISIIVLCYNQLDYTKECVESILNYTAYPNYELILVDNHSTDDTAEYLKSIAKTSDRIKLVLNQTNRGFAGGNNDGIAISDGDYIVLLNNDTVITKGWLTGLLKHFAPDGSVALVGPVTNSIGNEGKIPVDYRSISNMPAFAHQYTAAHMGEEYPHHGILAMYCLMISREFYQKAGPLDEKYGIGMFEDDDYSTAAQKMGYRIVMAEDVFIHHYGTVSFKKLDSEEYMKIFNENRKYFEKKWDTHWERQTMRPGVPMD